MNPIKYIRKKGIKRALQVIYQYKIDLVVQRVMKVLLKHKDLQDIIMIESHNDFDSNGGALYNYLVENGYNNRYKIVWLLKNFDKKPHILPKNVECVPLLRPSLKKNYYINIAKYFTADCNIVQKQREEQKMFFLRHGAGGLKKVKGKCDIDESVDYILGMSESYAEIESSNLSILPSDERFVYLGFPSHDLLFQNNSEELLKIEEQEYSKVILWMPTFRKGGGVGRVDSTIEEPLGIPIIESLSEYEMLNHYLNKNNLLLIIKIHPMQDLGNLGIADLSNIRVLTGKDVKELNVDNYRLMSCCDAMISDYSSVAYEFLQLDRPIAYVLSDMQEYKLGFVVDDIHTLIAGHEIYVLSDMIKFIDDVKNQVDIYRERRLMLRDYFYKYHDGNNCKRLVEFMGLKI